MLFISLFIVVPGFLWNLFEKAVSDIGAAWGTSANLSIYSAPMKLLIFQHFPLVPIKDRASHRVFNKDEYVPKYDRNGYEIIRDYCSQNDINKDGKVVCPKCNSRDIIIQKGDGFNIYGIDEIAIICNKCKKVYGFNDVKYKPNCPKEL